MKHKPAFYDLAYLQRPMSPETDVTRWANNGIFANAAAFIREFLSQNDLAPSSVYTPTALDVGCGRGWIVYNLRKMGIAAAGCEYSDAALEHSVCGARYGDVTDRLPYPDHSFDLVSVISVLSHFPADLIPKALQEIARVSRRYVWTHIYVIWDGTQPRELETHHLTVMPAAEWKAILPATWIPVGDALLEQFGLRRAPAQWSQVWKVR